MKKTLYFPLISTHLSEQGKQKSDEKIEYLYGK
jgi:hypothetical protein